MDFVGTGQRLSPGDVGKVAKGLGLPTAALLAIIEIETGGRGFDTKKRPLILFEPHRFYAELGKTSARATAVKAGLAYAKWGAKPYPKSMDTRYDQLDKAMAIARDAALKSASWGLPQILGSNHASAGYNAPVPMVEDYKLGEFEQLQSMGRLIADWGIAKSLIGKDLTKAASWVPFVTRYNGNGYAKHNYHGRIATAFKKHSQNVEELVTPVDAKAPVEQGIRGEVVMNLQNDLKAIGYDPGPIDGRFGPKTEKAWRRFENEHGLKVDGVFSDSDIEVLKKSLEKAPPVAHDPPEQTWAEQKNKNWLAVLIDAIFDVFFTFLNGVTQK